jgi:hypothetical protein
MPGELFEGNKPAVNNQEQLCSKFAPLRAEEHYYHEQETRVA